MAANTRRDRRRRAIGAAALAWALAGFLGCGSPGLRPVPARGTVTIDGAPLKGVQVFFDPIVMPGAPALPRSRAQTDGGGRYVLKCDTGQDGALPVTHRVTVIYAMSSHDQETALKSGSPRIPPEYSAAALTPLQVEVKADQDTYDLQLKSKR
jgi:hypothetical protein